MTLTSAYRRSEHVGVEAIVIPELKFRDVDRHIFGAHLVERADYAALEDRPEALNRVGMNSADHVLLAMMIDEGVRIFFIQFFVTVPSVGRQQANLVGNNLVHEVNRGFAGYAFQNAGDDVALALNGTDDRRFAGSGAPVMP